jgi:NitT/TauT family transport system ATP-binding protein
MYKHPSSLSGGMRQRVALIRTLATKPDILLLDEPFSALDYVTRLQVSDDVYNIIKSENKTVIMVTHDIAECISMSERVVILTKRPAVIKNIYEINLTDKQNPIHNRKAKEFAYYYDLFWKDLDKNE